MNGVYVIFNRFIYFYEITLIFRIRWKEISVADE